MLKPYPKYKDSGIEWIGKIPEQWDEEKVKYRFNVVLSNVDKKSEPDEANVLLCNYLDVYNNDFISSEITFMEATASKEQIERCNLLNGDIMITKDSEDPNDIGVPAIVVEDIANLVCGYHLAIYKYPGNKLDNGKFFFYLLKSKPINCQFCIEAKGITRYGITYYSIANVLLLNPSVNERQIISAFLDLQTSRIDSLVTSLTHKIELLKEYRTALINEVVTRGLNPNVKMKDSGIEWLGDIPEHWKLAKLKYLGEALIGITYSPSDIVDENKGTLVLRASNIQNGKVDYDDCVYLNINIPDKLVTRKGDILLCARSGSANLIGKNICIDDSTAGITFGAFMCIYRSKYWEYFFYFFNSEIFKAQSALFATTTINQLTNETLRNMQFAFPPDSKEQKEIVEILAEKTSQIDSLIDKEQKKIDKLKEYRTAIISEVVTGKVDVRDVIINDK